ncbi:MAG TPA: hypothetical protein DCG78_02270 [Anaerolineaceae bacterium]|nr:hypothetical protein [Anaerolineaceae bacterium]
MKTIIDLSNEEAKVYFLKGSSYFNNDLPNYVSFEPILTNVLKILDGNDIKIFQKRNPSDFSDVNYSLITNKDGKFAWRPIELIHPVIYVSLVNLICEPTNWAIILQRLSEFESGPIDCCSLPTVSTDQQKDVEETIKNWWQEIEQKSLKLSLEYSHILQTDVVDCYGSLYTHSIPWAIHGRDESKKKRADKSLLGNKIDSLIQAGRYGQTNGISQGSTLMDFIAELVLGFVDSQISQELKDKKIEDFHILRYRDDYRIFGNSDETVEAILQVVSEKLRMVGMKLGTSKTQLSRNIVGGSIKPDKLAAIALSDLGEENAQTLQKQLLRLHSFGLQYPNSGALRRLLSIYYKNLSDNKGKPKDLEVLLAIATDIGFVSPSTFPGIAGILSYLLSLAPPGQKNNLWDKVLKKMKHIPYNGFLEIWLQRIVVPKEINISFESAEAICRIVNGQSINLWENGWISNNDLKKALDTSNIVVKIASEVEEVVQYDEIALFNQKAIEY